MSAQIWHSDASLRLSLKDESLSWRNEISHALRSVNPTIQLQVMVLWHSHPKEADLLEQLSSALK